MSIEIKQLPKSEVEINGEISSEEFVKFWQKAIKELSKKVSIPGFRPGNIPEKILIEKVGENEILNKSAELAMAEVYPRIIKEHKIEAIGSPQITITKIAIKGPLGFKIQSAVLPAIGLPEEYKKIAAGVLSKKEEVNVEEKEIDASIDYIKKMKEKNPDNKNLPEINDELRNTIRKNLQAEKEFKQKEKKELEALEAILKESTIEIPDVLVEAEKKKMMDGLKSNIQNAGMKWEDYLKHIKKSEEEVLSGWAESASKRVGYGLLLHKLAETLNIQVTEEELKERVDKGWPKDYAYGIIRNEKVFSCLSQQ